MKKLLLIAAIAATFCACNNAPTFTLNGTTDGTEQEYVLLTKTDTLAVAAVENGKFTMKVDATTPAIARLVADGRPVAQVFVEVGDATYTKAGEERAVVAGTPSNDLNNEYNAKMQDIYGRYRNATTDEERQAIEAEADSLDYLEGNYDKIFGVFMFANDTYSMSADEMEQTAAKFTPELQQTQEIKDILTRAAAVRKTEVGQPYINIVLPDKDGNNVDLSTFVGEGKYVLVDFWASWCGPCMGEVPYLLNDYAAYHDKGFEIYGVSLDNDAAKWQAAINDNQMNWIQVSTLKGWENEFATAYAVSGIPTNFLLGPDGTIVAKDLRGEALGQKLAELLGESEQAEGEKAE